MEQAGDGGLSLAGIPDGWFVFSKEVIDPRPEPGDNPRGFRIPVHPVQFPPLFVAVLLAGGKVSRDPRYPPVVIPAFNNVLGDVRRDGVTVEVVCSVQIGENVLVGLEEVLEFGAGPKHEAPQFVFLVLALHDFTEAVTLTEIGKSLGDAGQCRVSQRESQGKRWTSYWGLAPHFRLH